MRGRLVTGAGPHISRRADAKISLGEEAGSVLGPMTARTRGRSVPAMIVMALQSSDAAGVPLPLVVFGVALLLIAGLIAEPARRGTFDRARGDDGERPVPDAEHDEFAAAVAAYCAREGDRSDAG
jgi:hypothetical protein